MHSLTPHAAVKPHIKRLTESDQAQRLPSDSGCSGRHLADLLHALDPRALPESLVQPGVSSVQVKDVTKCRVCCLFYSRRGNITHRNAWRRRDSNSVDYCSNNIASQITVTALERDPFSGILFYKISGGIFLSLYDLLQNKIPLCIELEKMNDNTIILIANYAHQKNVSVLKYSSANDNN